MGLLSANTVLPTRGAVQDILRPFALMAERAAISGDVSRYLSAGSEVIDRFRSDWRQGEHPKPSSRWRRWIGYEEPFSERFLLPAPRRDWQTFFALDRAADWQLVSGGRDALQIALEHSDLRSGDIVLLPSYICDSVTRVVRNRNLKPRFYPINSWLEIDLEQLLPMLTSEIGAVIVVNYFGTEVPHELFATIRKRIPDVAILYDCAQALPMAAAAVVADVAPDFVITSHRKFSILPDGALVIATQRRLNGSLMQPAPRPSTFYKWVARLLRQAAVEEDGFDVSFELAGILTMDMAEEALDREEGVFPLSPASLSYLDRLDWGAMMAQRAANAAYLYDRLPPELLIYTKERASNPRGVVIRTLHKMLLERALMKDDILVHSHGSQSWEPDTDLDRRNFRDTFAIREEILRLVIDAAYGEAEMQRQLDVVEQMFG